MLSPDKVELTQVAEGTRLRVDAISNLGGVSTGDGIPTKANSDWGGKHTVSKLNKHLFNKTEPTSRVRAALRLETFTSRFMSSHRYYVY